MFYLVDYQNSTGEHKLTCALTKDTFFFSLASEVEDFLTKVYETEPMIIFTPAFELESLSTFTFYDLTTYDDDVDGYDPPPFAS